MRLNQWVRLIDGSVVLVSVILGITSSRHWFILTVFVALNLIQSGFTDWCPSMAILRRAGVKE